ncbi:MAG TPA: amino acid permease [Candidatus Babeliales bacterium]|nr:amino acid permease [Candidatus Babeliales bacterium]
MASHKLSLRSAIFININIMLGSGIFINSIILAKKAGSLGAFTYPLVGIFMLPLILAMSKMVEVHPSGGFYTYGTKEISPFAGFLSAWSYVVGKLASAVIITQFAVLLLQSVIAPLAGISSIAINGALSFCFLLLNLLDTKSNSIIQTLFFWFKLIPISCAIATGLFLFSPSYLTFQPTNLDGLLIAVPLVFFALGGFEAACSISSHIENPSVNAPRSIFFSYGFVVLTTMTFQFLIYAGLGSALAQLPDYRYLFPTLVATIFPNSGSFGTLLVAFLHITIAFSALGGSYGIMFSNNWNVYTLARHNHLVGSQAIVQFNRYNIPYLCVLIEGVIYYLFLGISHGNQLPLQQIGAFGPTISYAISTLATWYAMRRKTIAMHPIIPVLAMGSCIMLLGASLYSLVVDGMNSLLLFGILLSIGIAMYLSNPKVPSEAA